MNPLSIPTFIRALAESRSRPRLVSKDFSWLEFFRSDTASRLGIKNSTSDPEILCNIAYLVHYVLQPLRERCGAIKINSGYRCKDLNEAVGGVKSSYHLYGRAADIVPLHCSLSVLEKFIKDLGVDLGVKYIRYSTFIHIQI